MRTIIIALALFTTTTAVAGEVIPRDKLPASIATAKKAPKFPGIPSCAKGRIILEELPDWQEEHPDHKCAKSTELYVCTAFGKLSVRCEGGK